MVVIVEYPTIVHVDNVGDILPLENTSLSKCTKYIGLHHHLIQGCIEDGTVIIKFVYS